jgi:hypothetical protein
MRISVAGLLLLLGFSAGFLAMKVDRPEGASPARATTLSSSAVRLPAPPSGLLERLEEPLPRTERAYAASERARALLARGAKVGASGTEVENPCTRPGATGCEAHALDPFFARLDALDAGRADEHAVVVAMGNSLIAADHITDVVRARLQGRFGDGGKGLLLAERISDLGERRRTGHSDGRWDVHYFSQGPNGRHPYGLTGAYHVSQRAGAKTTFSLKGQRRARLWWLDVRGGPALRALVDGVEVTRTSPSGDGGARSLEVELPEGARKLQIVATGRGAVVQGVVLEKDPAQEPGVLFDTVGLPAADSPGYIRANPEVFAAQLGERAPALTMVMLGGVENRRIAWHRYSYEKVRASLTTLLDRVKAASPDGACMVVGPIDAVEGMLDEKVRGITVRPFRERPQLLPTIELEREVAEASGCAFFDLYSAMGGAGSLRRFNSAGLLHEDHVHPRRWGLDLLGQLVVDALLDEWARTSPGVDEGARAARRQLLAGAGLDVDALRGAASPLAAFERAERRAVRVAVVDDAGGFADALRRPLASFYGKSRDALLPADDASTRGRIEPVGVVVEPTSLGERPGLWDLVVLPPADGAPAQVCARDAACQHIALDGATPESAGAALGAALIASADG